MRLSKDEIYFQRLLHRMKKRCRDDEVNANVYKLSASCTLLENLFSKLQDDKGIDSEALMQYGRDVQQLKILIDAERKKTAEDRLRSIQTLPRVFPSTDLRRRRGESEVVADEFDEEQEDESCSLIKARAKSVSSVTLPSCSLHGHLLPGIDCKLLFQVYIADLRKQLLGATKKDSLLGPGGDLSPDDVMAKQESLQADLAEDLLKLTYSLKNNFTVAGNVIRADNQTLSGMHVTAEANKSSLAFESKRLEHHAYRSWINCVMVAVVILVVWSFLAMVVLIKFIGKKM
uniref:Vesicle transport protein USE1 n=1 Tax=Steinernema glaseri TaxID=37863 RepID=A0A1I8A4R8_9BILA